MMETPIEKYCREWHAIKYKKPCNEQEFIDLFINHLGSITDVRDVSFDGDGSYFGKQISIVKDKCYFGGMSYLCFEIAYSKEQVRVYRGNSDTWEPEYISLKKEEKGFKYVYDEIVAFMKRIFLPE